MERTLSGPEASDALNDTGRRYLLDSLRTSVPARSPAEAMEPAARATRPASPPGRGGTDEAHRRWTLRR
ncbi:hypothetical protein ACFV4M_35130 [Kitasatospora indigofera]|uniref:hypothetical protein n=1 Tax=Kitasatospora indigofera TaxID=67307 RepID=UPI0036682131